MFKSLYESAHQINPNQGKLVKVQGQARPVASESRMPADQTKNAPKLASGRRSEKRPQSVDRAVSKKRKRDRPAKPLPPSKEAMELSRRLQDFSKRKRLKEALQLYWSVESELIRDGHHACILVDCCSRCGAVQEAEKIVNRLGKAVNVETRTALMKGYCHAGRLLDAMRLFRLMAASPDSKERPNVRTLNTLLRGCLWTAASIQEGPDQQVSGGVVSSEEAWALYLDRCGGIDAVDISSFEYSITLLCQALRVDEATARLAHYQGRYNVRNKGKAAIVGGDQQSLETLAVANLALARAYALLGRRDDLWIACQRALNASKASRLSLDSEAASVTEHNTGEKPTKIQGGKRAWKEGNKLSEEAQQVRADSNLAYRTHRLSELESDARHLLAMRSVWTQVLTSDSLARRLLTRVIYFSGGGTTGIDSSRVSVKPLEKSMVKSSFIPLWLSFGVSQLIDAGGDPANDAIDFDEVCGRVSRQCGANHVLHLDNVFADNSKPLDIELGAGFGSWIVQQAKELPNRNHVAVELRADRVSQIFTRSTLNFDKPLKNICIVNAECGYFLQQVVKKSSVATFFVNHPEPPTQTYGDGHDDLQSVLSGGEEPAHMLCSSTIAAMSSCLSPGGRMVIVSDNFSYARLIAATFVRVLSQNVINVRLRSIGDKEIVSSTMRRSAAFGQQQNEVIVYEGETGSAAIGHVKGNSIVGNSYFDRLWRTGASGHAERRKRYMIVMNRV